MMYAILFAAACGSVALAADMVQPPPTAAEIRTIEMQVELPDDANSLNEYIRYYYVAPSEQGRAIEGGYVSIYSVDPSKWPVGQVAIVHSYDDVPAPYDAGCGVVRIAYSPGRSKFVEARCDPGLELLPPSLVPGWMYTLVPLAPIAALLFFVISRWRAARRAQESVQEPFDVPGFGKEESLERTRES